MSLGLTYPLNIGSVNLGKFIIKIERRDVMPIILVVATDNKGNIGKDGKLPWGAPIRADMKRFREITMRGSDSSESFPFLVMGRATWESIGSRSLEGRYNIVLSRDKNFKAPGALVLNGVEDVLLIAHSASDGLGALVYVIGGAEVYQQFLPYAEQVYLTQVDGEFEGDVKFPPHDTTKWAPYLEDEILAGPLTPYNLKFIRLERIAPTIPK